jgi:hypothetical protein
MFRLITLSTNSPLHYQEHLKIDYDEPKCYVDKNALITSDSSSIDFMAFRVVVFCCVSSSENVDSFGQNLRGC